MSALHPLYSQPRNAGTPLEIIELLQLSGAVFYS